MNGGTTYRSAVILPSGITVEATIHVPDDAEYDDQHELTEAVERGVAVMVNARGFQLHRAAPVRVPHCTGCGHPEHLAGKCLEAVAEPGDVSVSVCRCTAGPSF